MDKITEEIIGLQKRIKELEQEKQIQNENYKKNSLDNNFRVIDDLLTQKKTNITRNQYSKSVPLARFYDEELVKHLEASYNLLRIMDDRLIKLENLK